MATTLFSIGTFALDGRLFAGAVRDEMVWEISRFAGLERYVTTLELLQDWPTSESIVCKAVAVASARDAVPLSVLRVEAPITPRQIFCVGANYRKHVIELTLKQPDPSSEGMSPEQRGAAVAAMMDERARTGVPYAFVKLPSAVTGPFDQIVLPYGAREPDWELELGVVIGKKTRAISRDQALNAVAGYVVANDITSRDRIYRPDLKAIGTDWLSSKNSATFLPLGPWIVPARCVPNPHDLRLTLKLNGQIMQNESTADMIFDVGRQIEYISSLVTLLPGDIICTGSPAGNGTHYQRFLRPGDVVEGTISGLGTQRLTCMAEGPHGEPVPLR